MRNRPFAIAALAAAALTTSACRNKQVAPAPLPAAEVAATPTRSSDSDRAAAEARNRAERERLERERLAAERNRVMSATIYFELDRSDLTAEARSTLDAKLGVLSSAPELRIRIAGHGDERGSDEYNLALAQRRAAAAKRYLVQRGIDASRIETVSFGEEQPACTESHEGCWSQNRRGEFAIVTAGGAGRTPGSF